MCPDCNREHPTFGPVALIQRKRPDGTLVAAEWTVERAANFTVPVGRHNGRKVACVAVDDRGWLEWAAASMSIPSARRAASAYLDFLGPAATASPNS